MPGNALAMQGGQRAVCVGRTGSGKTTLARYIMAVSPVRWIIIDRKCDDAFINDGGVVVLSRLASVKECSDILAEVPTIVVRPHPAEFRGGFVDEFIGNLHEGLESVGLMVDELYSLHVNGQPGDGLTSWLTRGRSKKQTFLGLAQRPAWISQFIFSEADIIYCMALNKEEDRKRVYDFVGDKRILEKVTKRHFWRYGVDDDVLQRGSPVTIVNPEA